MIKMNFKAINQASLLIDPIFPPGGVAPRPIYELDFYKEPTGGVVYPLDPSI